MGKRLGGITWKSVALEGVPLDGAALDGFVGLEECTDYSLDGKKEPKIKKREKNKKEIQKITNDPKIPLKRKSETGIKQVASKKAKFCNGFLVEDISIAKPTKKTENAKAKSKTGDNNVEKKPSKKGKSKKSKSKSNKNKQTSEPSKTDEDQNKQADVSAWMPYHVPDEILKALAEQGFDSPTKIQELCLPAAMLGRRDILGAAETGSGKTLAFGIPILAGIMKLKEKEDSGEDIYDVQFKKTSNKRKINSTVGNHKIDKKQRINKKQLNSKADKSPPNNSDDIEKASENDSDSKDNNDESNIDNENDSDEEKENINDESESENDNELNDDSDDSDKNYLHLSDMIDSDDLANSSDEENDQIVDPNDSESDDDDDDKNDENEIVEDEEEAEDDNVNEGIGCVKVIDNVDLPSPATVRTGKPLYALIITPTRELAMQISKHLTMAAKYTGIRIATLVGGMAQVKQERLLSRSPEVVVCTPGRLWELMQQGNPHLAQVDAIKFLAIDETDRMVERNHFDELRPLLERINSDAARRAGRQNFVMSATLTMTHALPAHMRRTKVTKRGKVIHRKVKEMTPQQKIKKLISMIGMTDPKIVDLTLENHGKSGTLTECKILCAHEQKDHYLLYILKCHPGRTIVFCNSIGCVKRLSQLFGLLQCRVLPLHAGMPQRQRLKNLERFRDDPRGVLVATDVAARGLDIPGVDHVVHYQVPRTAENYVHRSGRTARANKEGLAILIMEPAEASLYAKMCRTLDKSVDISSLPVCERVLTGLRECVSLARRADAAALVCKRRSQEAGWLQRAATECDIVVDDDFVPMQKKLNSQDTPHTNKELLTIKKQLETLLSKPIFPRGFSYKYPTMNDPKSLVVQEESALETVKKVLENGGANKDRRKSKNASLLELEKQFRPKQIGKKKKMKKSKGKKKKSE